ncbi:MAG TPA: permease-like cell division protein FtsX, partial [Candidatus Limnocylindrales bacterium]|nr:permease-like cell division protein FtsX [Candidatus Limnocylindrales bacterium]
QWPVTAILRLTVSPAEGEGIAKKAAGLAGARSAVYKDPEASWKEFLAAYPGLSALRTAGGNPLPGYVEVRMLPGRFSKADIGTVEDALRPLPQVERVLSGGEVLPRLMRVRDGVNAILWAGFVILCTVIFAIFFLLEKSRVSSLAADFDFLRERGIPARRIVVSRASGALLTGLFLSLAATGASAMLLFPLEESFPLLGNVIGPPEELLAPHLLVPAALFLVAVGLLSGAASLLGWRAAQSRPK